jgi:hypothetical protein
MEETKREEVYWQKEELRSTTSRKECESRPEILRAWQVFGKLGGVR